METEMSSCHNDAESLLGQQYVQGKAPSYPAGISCLG